MCGVTPGRNRHRGFGVLDVVGILVDRRVDELVVAFEVFRVKDELAAFGFIETIDPFARLA